MGLAAALSDQLDLPARARDPLRRQFKRRHATDPPAAHRRRWRGKRILPAAAPAPKHQGHDRAVLGGELEPAGGGHAGAAYLADDRGQAAVAKPFLHHRKAVFIAAAFGINQSAGGQASLGQGRSEQVAAADHPQHVAAGAGSDSGREQGRRGIVIGAACPSSQLVDRGDGEAATRQPAIDFVDPERESFSRMRPPRSLDGPDLGAQMLKARIRV